jgi:hypothetical protein
MKPYVVHLVTLFVSLSAAAPLAAAPAPKDPAAKPSDPFADPAPAAATSVDEMEEAALAPPSAPPAQTPATPPAIAAPPPPRTVPRARTRQKVDEPQTAVPAPDADQAGFVVELATNAFASGTLQGGLFAGARTAGGLIVGGLIDYASSSVDASGSSTSSSTFRIGAGVRHTFVHSPDQRVEMFGAADASAVFRSAMGTDATGNAIPERGAAGVTFAFGPGLRLWVHEQLALGYAARLRVDYLSGEAGAIASPATADTVSASATVIGFDGVFQLLAVF